MSIYRGAGGSGDATNDATVSQVQTYASQAATSATNAASSATAAAASASGASTSAALATSAKNDSVAISNTVAGYVASALASEAAASDSATDAAASAAAAAISEGGASASASDALDSANTATTQATAASTSATNSANSAASALAIYGNTTAMNTAVTNAGNSATAAATSATNAATSATAAAGSASNAATSASAASGSVTAVATSAANAATSASAAASSASSASGSATIATTQASNASTSAAAASNSATNAATSAITATTQAGIATTGATTATTQAGVATTQAGIATTQATSATSSAITATTQAFNASTSATNAASSETNSLANRNAAAASATNASTSASAAATSATSSATSASAAATSAAAASAVALGNEPVRHSVRPSLLLDFANTKQLDPRITFTRASTATFYDGRTTAKAEENLLLQSQDFDNASWTKTFSTVTANATAAPDGTSTAEKVIANSSANYHSIRNNINITTGLNYTISIYAKSAEYTTLSINDFSNGIVGCTYDLTAVTAGTPIGLASTNRSATITSVGNGWYRCTLSFTSTSTNATSFTFIGYPTGATIDVYGANYTGDGTSGVFLWGAQLEQRSSVTAYTPTTTAAITNYIPALQTAASGVPRFDHNPTTGESLGLLIEEQRVNLLTYSEDFSNAAWGKSGATISSNTVIAPDGTLTGDKLVENTSAGFHYITLSQSNITTDNLAYTCSISVAPAGRTWILFETKDRAGVFRYASFNLATGAWGTVTAGLTTSAVAQGNGVYRLSVTIPAATGGIAGIISLFNATGDGIGAASYTGNGFSGIYIWGAQLEAGAFATSYIPTVASQVTRSPDAASITGTNFSSWYRTDEGTVYTAFNTFNSAPNILSGQGTSASIFYSSSLDLKTFNGTTGIITINKYSLNTTAKTSLTYSQSGRSLVLNGGTVYTSTGLFQTITQLSIGQSFGGYINGCIQKIAYYPKALTSAELIGLTTV